MATSETVVSDRSTATGISQVTCPNCGRVCQNERGYRTHWAQRHWRLGLARPQPAGNQSMPDCGSTPRNRREDAGMKASRLSREISPEQVAELMAIKWFSIASDETRIPTPGLSWSEGGIYPPMVALGLIRGDKFPGGWSDPKARIARLTKLGELTIHFLAKRVMVAAGVMARAEPDEEAEAA